jgi:hypothetical protein
MGSNIARFDAVRTAPIASITAAYTPFGIPFAHAMRLVHFVNDSNGVYMISFDGVTDNVPLLMGGFDLYDLTSDEDSNESFRYQNATQLYIRYIIAPTVIAAGSSNTVYAVAVYGKGE